jgi:hypothetical protein
MIKADESMSVITPISSGIPLSVEVFLSNFH